MEAVTSPAAILPAEQVAFVRRSADPEGWIRLYAAKCSPYSPAYQAWSDLLDELTRHEPAQDVIDEAAPRCPHCGSDQVVDLPTLLAIGEFSDTDRSVVHCDSCDWLYCDGLPMTEHDREIYLDAEAVAAEREAQPC